MDVLVALHAAAALLLLVAGLAKIARPQPTTDLLVSLGVPAGVVIARLIGMVESVVGVAALAVGGPVTALSTGVFYVAFVVVVVRAMRAGAASCGCFGRVDSPPSWIHVIGNLVMAAVSFTVVGANTPLDVMDGQPAAGVGFILLVGVLAGLALIAFTALPEALGARRPSPVVASFRLDEERR